MKEVVKQRLVGALILLALGVIFWPIIFVDPETEIDIESLQMPPRPESQAGVPPQQDDPFADIDAASLPAPEPEPLPENGESGTQDAVGDAIAEQPEPGESSGADDGEPRPGEPEAFDPGVPAAGETRKAPMAEPQLDDRGLPVVWTLQVVSLSDGIKAEVLRQDLLADGHKAYVNAVTVDGKTLYRVHIGPKAERAQLEALQAELDRRLGVASMIRRYLP